jgi:hypothetical protein
MTHHDDTELLDPVLLADVRAAAPPVRTEFRAELDRRVAAGFKPDGGPRSFLAGLAAKAAPQRRFLLPAMGAATTLIVALVVVVGALRDDPAVQRSQFGVSAPSAVSKSAVAPSEDSALLSASTEADAIGPTAAGVASAAPAPQALKRAASPGFGRKVEHRTELTLSTSNKKLQDVSDGVVRVTQDAGGIVERSNVNSSDAGGTATFTLSIPSARLSEALKQLSKLAHVSAMSQGSTDITRSFVSAASELSDARAERKALLKALGVATTAERIATLKARLRDNRSVIANYNGQLKALRRRTDNTTVSVTVNGDGTAPSSSGGGWKFSDAAGDTLKVLEVVAAVIMISAAILIPLGLLATLAAFAMRGVTRRRREQALVS